MGKGTVAKTTVEFIVRGKETYYALHDYGNTRKEVVEIVEAVFKDALGAVAEIIAQPHGPDEPVAEKVKLIFKKSRVKATRMQFKNVPLSRVFEIERALIQAQMELLNKAAAL